MMAHIQSVEMAWRRTALLIRALATSIQHLRKATLRMDLVEPFWLNTCSMLVNRELHQIHNKEAEI